MSGSNGNGRSKKPNGRSSPRVSSLREITISYEGHDETIEVKPPNLSKGGMFINTSRSFPEGAVLNLRFELLLTGAVIETRCEVRHCRPGVGIGVQFVGLSEREGQLIEEEIGRYEERTAPRPSHHTVSTTGAAIRRKRRA
jgi:hypothetical protein